jgi:hypothetical protein
MKRQKHLILAIVALTVALLLAVGPVAARATKTAVTGTECFVSVVDPGTYWLSDDGVLHLRGYVQLSSEESTDPRVVGSNTVVVNADWRDFDPNTGIGVGPMWGTYRIEVGDGEGFWDGTWTGMFHADGSMSTRAHADGSGHLEGLKIFVTVERASGTGCGEFTGYILNIHGE